MREVIRYSEAFKLRLVEDVGNGKYQSLDEARRRNGAEAVSDTAQGRGCQTRCLTGVGAWRQTAVSDTRSEHGTGVRHGGRHAG
jgi:transposase-like protein